MARRAGLFDPDEWHVAVPRRAPLATFERCFKKNGASNRDADVFKTCLRSVQSGCLCCRPPRYP